MRYRGSLLVEICAWLLFILPGILYSVWRMTTRRRVCPSCHQEGMIPTDSPRGQELSQRSAQAKQAIDKVEHWLTARGGSLTYRVLADEQLSQEELRRRVMEALQTGRLREPESGGTATLIV